MQYSKILMALMAAAVQAQNIVTFVSLDDVDRTVHFTPSAGYRWMEDVKVAGGETIDVTFDQGWIGNYYSVIHGEPKAPGMLGEVAFQGYLGKTFYDVSAIVKPADVDNVTEMYPADDPSSPVSGCGKGFPCNNAYYHPDDVQTKVTDQTHLITTLGKNGYQVSQKRAAGDEGVGVKRDFVLGKW